ncbi:hypothetical protein CU254_05740 [Amycolatopsis sp. AA4]|nr:hypothetical protein CU254_05740 [Amycolatopsis sp. AA4]
MGWSERAPAWSDVAVKERKRKILARRAEVLALRPVPTWHHARILPPEPGEVRISEAIGPFGELTAVWSAPADRAVRVTVHVPEMAVAARIPELRLESPEVQPLPDGRVLLVGPRCDWRTTGLERNAIVFDSDGEVVAEQTFGDGILHVQASGPGRSGSATSTKACSARAVGARTEPPRRSAGAGWSGSRPT